MNKRVLIVEDQYVESNDMELMLEKAGYEVVGIARTVALAQDLIQRERPDLVLVDILLKGKLTGIDLGRQLKEENIAFIYVSANSNEELLAAAKATEPYGFIVKPFREKDLLITLEIAQYRHLYSRESRYRREYLWIDELERSIPAGLPWREKLLQIGKFIRQEIPFDYLAFSFEGVPGAAGYAIGFLRIGFNEYQIVDPKEPAIPESAFFNGVAFEPVAHKHRFHKLAWENFNMRSLLSAPLVLENGEKGGIFFYGRRANAYSADSLKLLRRLQPILVRHIGQRPVATNTVETKTPFRHASPEGDGHISPDGDGPGFQGIVGSSHLLLNIYDQIVRVAPFDTSVLILGESGTGKDRIAECIYKLSGRKGKPFVKINCAALPPTMFESELFGFEKGAFTGAVEKRIGKFEKANGGTIFLDEVGEIPIDLQVKLLRTLQEKEIEPIGGRAPVSIDVRFIAATNKNLEQEVAEGRFRLDLYYRLNVFPIFVPPLRDRKEDIHTLAQHFIRVYNRRSGKNIAGLSDKVLKNMQSHSWPGNIRELEHFIERSVLLARGQYIEDFTLSPTVKKEEPPVLSIKTIRDQERDYIIEVLKKCNGKVWGAGGAAEILKMPPSTLASRMKKLGIKKNFR